jgi:hypothetical protein
VADGIANQLGYNDERILNDAARQALSAQIVPDEVTSRGYAARRAG